LIVFKKISQSD